MTLSQTLAPLLLTALLCLCATGCRPAHAEGPVEATGPVVVELFTSQGCSSCPPADVVLSRLAQTHGDKVIPLSFHVDYWNGLGWPDPFSSLQWTERQRRYTSAFGDRRIYTPQLVIHGQTHVVGSRGEAVHKAIASARPGAGTAALRLETRAIADKRPMVEVKVEATPGAALPPGTRLQVLAVVYEDGLKTRVPRGENAGRLLNHDRVVRHLEVLGELGAGAPFERSALINLDPGWNRARLGVVVIVQDPGTMAIHAAATDAL